MNFNLYKSGLSLFTFIFLCSSCTNSPAINDKYDFNSVKYIKIDKISDHLNFPGSGKIMEDNLSFMKISILIFTGKIMYFNSMLL